MGKQQNKQRGTKYRAVCEEGDYRGEWRNTQEQALSDANEHMIQHDDHIVIVELRAFVH